MATFANRSVDKLSFYQWINMEYSMVKREYKEAPENVKQRLKKEYEKYLSK